jgi:transcription elongation factor Elf1
VPGYSSDTHPVSCTLSKPRILSGVEYFFACPYCSERISMVLDTSVKRQTYIEDCEVCCQPIEVRYSVEDDEVRQFEARVI